MGFLAAGLSGAGAGAGATGAGVGAGAAGTGSGAGLGAEAAGAAGTAGAEGVGAAEASTLGTGLAKAFQVMSDLKKQGLLPSGGGSGTTGLNSKVNLVPVQFSPQPQARSSAQDFINAMLSRR
jgi:hypothetical protein